MQKESGIYKHIISEEKFCTHSKLHIQCHLKVKERNLVLMLCYPALQEVHFIRSSWVILHKKKVLIVCEEWPPSHLKEWDSLAKHLSKLQFLITCDSCTCTISCTTGEIWLFFLTFPLLLGAELQLVIVRTCRPFPSLHKGHPLTNDPFCKPNALHLGNWRGRH